MLKGKKRLIILGACAGILLLQLLFKVIPENKVFHRLSGMQKQVSFPEFNWSGWTSGKWQTQFEDWVQVRMPFRSVWVRSFNEVHWRVFGRISARPFNPVVPGENGTLFERQYLQNWMSNDSVDEGFRARLQAVSELSDSLKARGIHLVVMASPSKPHVYPWLTGGENWRQIGTRNAHRIYLDEVCEERNLLCLNPTSWFHKMAFAGDLHLFPKGGTHWSYYGAWLAVDSLANLLNPGLEKNGVQMAKMKLISKQPGPPRETDKDLAELANLWSKSGVTSPIPFPIWSPENGGVRPRFLLIGDSFLWTLVTHLQKHKSNQEIDFLYYNKRLFEYPENTNQVCSEAPDKCSPWKLAQNKHIVLLEANEIVLPELGWGAVEKMLEELKVPEEPQEPATAK